MVGAVPGVQPYVSGALVTPDLGLQAAKPAETCFGTFGSGLTSGPRGFLTYLLTLSASDVMTPYSNEYLAIVQNV
jgi:hypothetical protein